ncbi:LamG domain-containing protein [Amycolatopsis sp. 195334CR]|nr:LamG domain-containing protein [Amycolatopsis sp. 195334CR]
MIASLFSNGTAIADEIGAVSPEIASALAKAESSGQEVPVASETTEYAEVVAGPDGALVSRQSLEPQRVRRGDAWVPVDLTLETRPDGTIGPKAGFVDVRFSGGGTSEQPLASVVRDGREVGIGWPGALPAPVLDGAVATYPETLPGIDLVLTAKATGYSQVLVVKNAEAAQDPRLKEIAFPNHAVGVTPRLTAAGGIEAVDNAGVAHFLGDASKMWDSRGSGQQRAAAAAETPATATMDVDVTDSAVVVRPDEAFLKDPARVYPVFIDPEYWWAGAKQNHVVVQSGDFANARNFNRTDGDLADLKAGYQNGYLSRSYFNFDVSAMRGKVIHRAAVRTRVIHSWSCNGGPTELNLAGGIGPDTTWNNQPWVAGHYGDISRSNHAAYCPSDGWSDAPITDLMKAAANEQWTNMVFRLKARSEGSTSDWRRFDLNPVLEVVYNSVPDKPGQLGMENGQIPCASGENRPYVFTPTPRLRGKLTDPDAGTLQAHFSLHKGAVGASTQIWTGSTGNIPSGSFAEVTVPSGLVTEEGIYNWSMSASDGGSPSSWVGSCEFAVDKTVPGQPGVSSTDYPAGGSPAGGLGQTGTFAFTANGTTDVRHYLWSVSEQEHDDPKTRADADGLGGPAVVRWTPVSEGLQTMFVRSVDRAGNLSEIVKYRLNVRYGDPLLGNLTGHWKLNGNADDSSGNNRHLAGPSGTTAGYDGQAATLDGLTQRLSRPGPVVDTSKSFSVAAWAKLDKVGGWPTLLSQDGVTTSGFQLQATHDGRWGAAMFSQDVNGGGTHARAVATTQVQVGVWTHLVAAYDHGSGRLRLYVNGALAAEVAHTSTWSAGGDFQVGASQWNGGRVDFFPGALDEIRAYQRVIVPSEAALLANQAVLRAHYPLGEGSGSTATDSVSGAQAQFGGTAAWSQGEYTGAKFAGQGGAGFGVVTAPRPTVRTDRSYTVSAWVYLDEANLGARTAVSFGGAQYSPFMLQYRPELKRWNFLVALSPTAEGGWWIPAAGEVATGRWVHLTGVYDLAAAEARVYVDGVYSGRVTGVTGWNGTGDLLIGAGRWNGKDADPWQGSVRGVRLYSGALSDQQIGQLPGADL